MSIDIDKRTVTVLELSLCERGLRGCGSAGDEEGDGDGRVEFEHGVSVVDPGVVSGEGEENL